MLILLMFQLFIITTCHMSCAAKQQALIFAVIVAVAGVLLLFLLWLLRLLASPLILVLLPGVFS